MHPWLGLDHGLLILAAGFLSAMLPARERVLAMSAFVVSIGLGAWLGPVVGAFGLSMWFLLALSLLAIGMVTRAARASAVSLLALGGCFHGAWHTVAGGWAPGFGLGLSLAMAVALGIGWALGRRVQTRIAMGAYRLA